jgi:gamma-glutamylcyclotransferase (GGCT)/AIG2-like uncharacterized protein YtfP
MLSKCKYLGTDLIPGKLYVPGLPFFKPTWGILHNNTVKVDVYDVDNDTLERLDRMEGHPRWYTRIKVLLLKREKECYVYAFLQELDEEDYVPSGDYLNP